MNAVGAIDISPPGRAEHGGVTLGGPTETMRGGLGGIIGLGFDDASADPIDKKTDTHKMATIRSRATSSELRRKKSGSSSDLRTGARLRSARFAGSATGSNGVAEVTWPVRRQRKIGENSRGVFPVLFCYGGWVGRCDILIRRHRRRGAEHHRKEARLRRRRLGGGRLRPDR